MDKEVRDLLNRRCDAFCMEFSQMLINQYGSSQDFAMPKWLQKTLLGVAIGGAAGISGNYLKNNLSQSPSNLTNISGNPTRTVKTIEKETRTPDKAYIYTTEESDKVLSEHPELKSLGTGVFMDKRGPGETGYPEGRPILKNGSMAPKESKEDGQVDLYTHVAVDKNGTRYPIEEGSADLMVRTPRKSHMDKVTNNIFGKKKLSPVKNVEVYKYDSKRK